MKRRSEASRTAERAVELTQEAGPKGLDEPQALSGRKGQSAYILEEDPELGEALPPDVLANATRLFRAPVIIVDRPRWEPPALDPKATYGLLVLDGLIGRRVRVGRGVSTELLGWGDVLRPWDEPCLWNLIPPELDWRVFRPTRLAVLDERITRLIGRRAELLIAFSSRLFRRARHAEYMMAVSHLQRVDQKVLATLWHMASTWGRVTPEGVYLPLRLTHEVLGEIIGAQRPSVTMAMQRLHQRGEVIRTQQGGYLLTGSPTDWNRDS